MSFYLGKRSRANLNGVHPDLIVLVATAIQLTEIDFAVIEGIRTLKRQRQLVASGVSWTLRSRHLTGHAVDLGAFDGDTIIWAWPPYQQIATAMQKASELTRIPLEWGGDWTKHRDGPHFQLPRSKYP